MQQFLNKLFNIRTSEWPRVLLFFSIAMLTQTVALWGTTVAYAAFLKNVGLAALPGLLVLNSLLGILAIAIYTAFADRLANDRLLMAFYVISAAGLGVGMALLAGNLTAVAYPLFYLIDLVLSPVFVSHFTTYVTEFYDIQATKRVLPVIFAGFRAGTIVAGLSLPFLTGWCSHLIIMLIWLVAYGVIAGLVRLMPRFLHDQRQQPQAVLLPGRHPSAAQRTSYLANLREGFAYILQSTYLRWLSLSTFLLMALLALLQYMVGQTLLQIYPTAEGFANFLAVLTGVSNLAMLPLLFFVMGRLLTRLGVRNATLLFPVCNLAVCAGIIVFPGQISAAAAHLNQSDFSTLLLSPVEGLLYNAIPLRIRGRARAFVGGLIVPLGALVGSLALMLPVVTHSQRIIPTLVAALALAYLGSALAIRQHYRQALISMLAQEDYASVLLHNVSDLPLVDPLMLEQLQQKLQASTDHDSTVFLAQLISQIGGAGALDILSQAARTAGDEHTRAAILGLVVALDIRTDEIRHMYAEFLADQSTLVGQVAISGFEQLAEPTDQEFLERMLALLTSQDLRVQALSALARAGAVSRFPQAGQALDHLLADRDPEIRGHGVRVLGCIGDDRAIARLIPYVTDPDDKVRLEAASVLETRAGRPMSPELSGLAAANIDQLLHDPIERVRQIALSMLGRLPVQASTPLLVSALHDSSPRIRETAAEALVLQGDAVIPALQPLLESAPPPLRKMLIVVLSRINPREFGALVKTTIMENLAAIYQHYAYLQALSVCAGYQSIPVLQSTLHEHNRRFLDEIFDLLKAIHPASAVTILADSLRSPDPHTRSNAVEALESMTTPHMARLLAPLFEPELPIPLLQALNQEIWNREQPTVMHAFRDLVVAHADPWVRTVTIFALGEISAALISKIKHSFPTPTPPEPARSEAEGADRPPSRRHARQRVSMNNLFDTLNSADAGAPEELVSERAASPSRQESFEKLPEVIADSQAIFALPEMESLVDTCLTAGVTDEVRQVIHAARRMSTMTDPQSKPKERIVFSTIEKIIFLKEVAFFRGMTIEQLKVLATVCEEQFFSEGDQLFHEGDPGGALYVVVNGSVGIEREKRTGSVIRLHTHGPHAYFGEVTLFDGGPRTATAVAIRDTLTLRIRCEPLMALARQYPELSLELIHALSRRLRETYDRVTDLTRSRPRELQNLFDQYE